MAIKGVQGLNYWFNGTRIHFFGAEGFKEDDRWAVNALFGAFLMTDPDSMMPSVKRCIETDVKAGQGDQIAQIHLGPYQAVTFFLEGMLTPDHLDHAIEGPDYIDVPNVTVEGRTVTIRILKEFDPGVATADKDGVII